MNYILAHLSMGHYGLYVWSAYGLAAMVMLLHLLGAKRQRRQMKQRLLQWFKS